MHQCLGARPLDGARGSPKFIHQSDSPKTSEAPSGFSCLYRRELYLNSNDKIEGGISFVAEARRPKIKTSAEEKIGAK